VSLFTPLKSLSGGVKFRIKTQAVVPCCPTADALLSKDAQRISEVSGSPTESGNTSKSRIAANLTVQTEGEVAEEATLNEIRLDVMAVCEMTARGSCSSTTCWERRLCVRFSRLYSIRAGTCSNFSTPTCTFVATVPFHRGRIFVRNLW
jgi:hypothetical protein